MGTDPRWEAYTMQMEQYWEEDYQAHLRDPHRRPAVKPVPPSMKYLDEADAKDAQSEALEDEALALLAGIHGPDSKELQDLAMSKAVEADGIAKEANRLREEAFSLARLMERDTGAPSGEERLQAKANLDAAKDERRRRAFIDLKDLDNDMWRGVFDTLGLGRNGMLDKKTRPVSGPMIVPDFCWDDSDKDAQSHSLIHHLKSIIDLGHGDAEWVDAAKDYPHLLCYYGLEDFDQNLTGTTDLLVADCSAVKARVPQLGMRVLFHVTKEIKDLDHTQAEARLLLANLLSAEERPMVVLTDLCEIWYALWMDDREIFRVLFPTKESAVEFVNDLLARRFEACHSGLRAKAAQRRELDL